jgi:Glycine cleavage system T protein (aminomethyltransferase)
MILTSPFHERTSALNETGLWSHWSGHLAADRYQMSDKFEYFAVRNSAGIFDSSPLYKYRIHGPDAERFLAGVLARDIRACPPGHAQYTVWCDDRGFVVEDGVVLPGFRRPGPPTPIDGYYQCGSGTHPGGCVMGAPGKLAAQRILRDLGKA